MPVDWLVVIVPETSFLLLLCFSLLQSLSLHGGCFPLGSVLLSTKNAQTLVKVGAADVIFVCFLSGFAPTAPTFRVRTLLVQCTNKMQVGARWCTIDYSDLTEHDPEMKRNRW